MRHIPEIQSNKTTYGDDITNVKAGIHGATFRQLC